jgi:FAD:protein FMN transferase
VHKPTTVAASEKLIWRERNMIGFGTTLWIKAAHENVDQLETALTAAVAAIRNVERQMSLFDPESALCRLNAHGVLQQPDVDLTAVLNLSKQVSMRSAGAFDVSMQPLWKVWSQAKEESRLPYAARTSTSKTFSELACS